MRIMDKKNRGKVWRIALLVLILISAFLLIRGSGIRFQDLTPLKIKEYLLSYGTIKAALIYFLIYTFSIRPLVPVPPTLYTLAGGFTFGPVLGTILTIIGATFNASISFMIARLLGRDFVEKILKGKLGTLNDKLADSGFKTLLVIRSSPIGPPFDLVSYAAGVLRVSFWSHFFATMIGIIPATSVYSYFGGSITKGGFYILIGFFLVVVFSIFIPWVIRKQRLKSKSF
ncbi:MAG TPA: TVP38/TMEM64 family protein [Thermodesulfobacteriota bacterium]|nr:TVP38/TMEM64 family protein [Thermodesulfobacteriota bacterium]